jgi:hypothetical protein
MPYILTFNLNTRSLNWFLFDKNQITDKITQVWLKYYMRLYWWTRRFKLLQITRNHKYNTQVSMSEVYEAWHWDGLSCHATHSKFHKDWLRNKKVDRRGYTDKTAWRSQKPTSGKQAQNISMHIHCHMLVTSHPYKLQLQVTITIFTSHYSTRQVLSVCYVFTETDIVFITIP